MENIADKPLYALEEQLARQQGILCNSNLLRKLPDKGTKLRESVSKLEVEIENRKKEIAKKQANVSLKDVKTLEWTLSGSHSSYGNNTYSNGGQLELDSDDEVDASEDQRTLQIVATSQISQRQPKPSLVNDTCELSNNDDSDHLVRDTDCVTRDKTKLDKYVARLVHVDSSKPSREKYVPGKSKRTKPEGSESPTAAESSTSKQSSGNSTPSMPGQKWAECLLPPAHTLDAVKFLPLDESIKISEEKYKNEEEITATKSAPRKMYAYDKLKEQCLLGTYSVEMQVSRPIQPDAEDEDLDDDDLSEDHITEDSESDGDDVNQTNQKSSKDLSNLLNASLKLK